MSGMQLYLGDCLEVMKNIPDHSIDMVLCDLPYGTTSCSWDIIIPFDNLWEQYRRIIKDNGAILLFGTEPFSSKLRLSNLEWYKYDIIWEKERPTNFILLKKQIGKCHENISVFYKKQPTYNPQMILSVQPNNNDKNKNVSQKSNMNKINSYGGLNYTSKIGNNYNPKLRYPRSIIKFSRGTKNTRYHPTQKPVNLCEYLIKTYSNEGDTVLDNCMGSGTTGVACINTDRKFIGIEKEEKYFEIAKKRIEDERKSFSLWE